MKHTELFRLILLILRAIQCILFSGVRPDLQLFVRVPTYNVDQFPQSTIITLSLSQTLIGKGESWQFPGAISW